MSELKGLIKEIKKALEKVGSALTDAIRNLECEADCYTDECAHLDYLKVRVDQTLSKIQKLRESVPDGLDIVGSTNTSVFHPNRHEIQVKATSILSSIMGEGDDTT